MGGRVNPYSVTPKYHQLYEILRERIESGDWEPHEAIPSERELEEDYGISRTTVRQALNMLVNEGFLYRSHGKGTFVSRPKVQHSLQHLTSFTQDMRLRGFEPGQELLYVGRVEPSTVVRQQLKLMPGDDVLKIERLRFADEEPIGIHSSYLPLAPDETITEEELQATGSLYRLLDAKFSLIIAEADELIESVLANEREAELLNIPVGSPLLLIQRTTWSHRREPMEWVKMLYRADRYKLSVRITV